MPETDACQQPLEQRYEMATPDVVADAFDGEVVIINLDSGAYFAMTGDSGVVWQAVVSGADLTQVPDARRDELGSFVAALVDHCLVRVRSGVPVSADVPTWTPGTLTVEAFSDLQDLLTLDPVHDVDSAAGWPATPPIS